LPAGDYELVVVDAFGCDFRANYRLLPPPELLLELGADRELLLGDTIVLSPQPSRPVLEYRWQARETLSGPNPILRPQRSQLVSLTVVDELGCRASDTLFVTVLEDLPVYAPTAFAPSGSGQNTHFTLYGEGNIVAIRELQIFNRWGTLVFERQNFAPNQPLLGWDGRLDGQLLNSAVFVWLAEVELPDGRIVQLAGDVLLMR
jgi:gliding motility-associated-like protein